MCRQLTAADRSLSLGSFGRVHFGGGSTVQSRMRGVSVRSAAHAAERSTNSVRQTREVAATKSPFKFEISASPNYAQPLLTIARCARAERSR